MLLRLTIIAACLVSLAAAGSKSYSGDDLEALCNGKPIRLQSLTELESLVTKLDTDMGAGCPEEIASALRDLYGVVLINKYQECSMKAYENYRQFYKEYLDTSERKVKKRSELNKSIRLFALAYGITLSGSCRLNMINNLLHDDLKEIVKADFERPEIRDMIAHNGSIAEALGYSSQKPDDMTMPGDFLELLAGPDSDSSSKISLKLVSTAAIKRLQTICERRFGPIYKPVMLPVAKFADLGFDYRKALLKHEIKAAMKDESTRDLIGKWTRAAFMCELMGTIQLIERDEDAKRSEGNDATLVKVARKETSIEEGERNLLDDVDVHIDDIEPLDYEPNLQVGFNDKIYGSISKAVAVSMVFTSLSEKTRKRLKLIKKLLKNLKKQMSAHKLSGLFEEAKKVAAGMNANRNELQGFDAKKLRENVVQQLNGLVARELNPERAVAEGLGKIDVIGCFFAAVVAAAVFCWWCVTQMPPSMFGGR